MCVHTRENPLTGSVSDTIGRSPRSFIPPCRGPFRFHFHPPACTASSYPPPARTSDRRQRTRQLASAIRNLRGSMAGRKNYFEPHETTHTTTVTKQRSKGKRSRGNRRDTRFTTRPLFVACAMEPCGKSLFPFSLERIVICIRSEESDRPREQKTTKNGWNLLMRPCDRKCFRSAGSGAKRTINRCAETSNRDDTLWHPPKGAPREPSTSCCQSCRAAAMARASRSQRLRRRHPSHAADILPATLPVPYLFYKGFARRWIEFSATFGNFICTSRFVCWLFSIFTVV